MKWKTVIPRLVAYAVTAMLVAVVIYYSAVLCVSLFVGAIVLPALEPPEHHIIIDKVEPEVPGLKLGEHPGNLPSRMDLVITNYTGQDVYVVDPQINQMVKIAGGGGLLLLQRREWQLGPFQGGGWWW